MAEMRREMEGGDCEFLRHKSKFLLWSTGFGYRITRGREASLHSRLGEGFALDWVINNNCSMLWGFCFTSITDFYGLCFILTYKGPNPVVLRMQMRPMLWSMYLYHRCAAYLVSRDYFSHLGVDLCFNEMMRLYLTKTINPCKLYPPTSGGMRTENMPGYCDPHVRSELTTEATNISANLALSETVDQCISPLLTSVMIKVSGDHKLCLQAVPILTGFLTEV